MPSANSVKASRPTIGRKASAACAAVAMWVTPCVASVSAVVSMMKKPMVFDTAMPNTVSAVMRASWRGACSGATRSGFSCGAASCSSTSWEACQKNR